MLETAARPSQSPVQADAKSLSALTFRSLRQKCNKSLSDRIKGGTDEPYPNSKRSVCTRSMATPQEKAPFYVSGRRVAVGRRRGVAGAVARHPFEIGSNDEACVSPCTDEASELGVPLVDERKRERTGASYSIDGAQRRGRARTWLEKRTGKGDISCGAWRCWSSIGAHKHKGDGDQWQSIISVRI